MKRTVRILAVLCLAAVCLAVTPAGADELAQAGRQIVTKCQDAVVTAQLIVKTSVSYDGQEMPSQEEQVEANALIIDPSGLAVTALSEINPEESLQDFLGEEADKYKVSTDIVSVKLLMGNGQEIPASIVLRDKELDLAFLRPTTKPEKPLTAIDLAKASKPLLLDQVLALSRHGIAANRALAASIDRIETVVEKPRFFCIPDQGLDMGAGVFTLDGGFAGMVVMRQLPATAGTASWYDNSTQVVVHAADIQEAAKQAP